MEMICSPVHVTIVVSMALTDRKNKIENKTKKTVHYFNRSTVVIHTEAVVDWSCLMVDAVSEVRCSTSDTPVLLLPEGRRLKRW